MRSDERQGVFVKLYLQDNRGAKYWIPGRLECDHGPAFEHRYLVVANGYEDFGPRVLPSPCGLYVTWASEAMIDVVRAEAA